MFVESENQNCCDTKDYDFNYGYLVKHFLVEGEVHSSDDGTECFTPCGGITGDGMDIVESFIDGCVENIEKVENKVFDKTLSNLNKITELAALWATNRDLYQQAWEFMAQLIR